jgi:hypothetical protein
MSSQHPLKIGLKRLTGVKISKRRKRPKRRKRQKIELKQKLISGQI